MKIGIIGSEGKKFSQKGKEAALTIIRTIIQNNENPIIVSGHCHLGGIDIWAEEEAAAARVGTLIFPPKSKSWEKGYKPRNILIAKNSDVVHVITIDKYPIGYTGMRFNECYHCGSKLHIKSGGCWTAKLAQKLGKEAYWHVVENA